MPRKEPAKGEGPGIMGVQVGQRETQHTQCVPWLVVLQEGQDAICRKKAGVRVGRRTSHLSPDLGPTLSKLDTDKLHPGETQNPEQQYDSLRTMGPT